MDVARDDEVAVKKSKNGKSLRMDLPDERIDLAAWLPDLETIY